MTLTPLLDAPLVIQIHVIAACAAVLLGPLAMLRRNRDIWHKRLGRTWVLAMVVTALSSFAINEIRMLGPFSVIHALSVLTLIGLWQAVAHARRGQIAAHRKQVLGLYTYAIGIAGLFTLLPGRRMSEVLFPASPWTGFWTIAALLSLAILAAGLQSRRA